MIGAIFWLLMFWFLDMVIDHDIAIKKGKVDLGLEDYE